MLQLTNIYIKYVTKEDQFELNLDLEIPNPSFIVITGESGAGKSTFAKTLAGIIPMNRGTIKLDNKDITSNLKKYVEYLEANEPLINNFTVYQTLYARCNHLYNKDEVEDKIEGICSSLKLTNLMDQKIIDLSGGEAQRVAVGCMMLSTKPILILDEATHSLDKNNSVIIVNMLKEVKNKTIIYITHKPEEVEGMQNMSFNFENGKIAHRNVVKQSDDNRIYLPSINNTRVLSIVKSNFYTGIKGHVQTLLSYLLLFFLCSCFLTIGTFVTSVVNQYSSDLTNRVFYPGSGDSHNGICGQGTKYNVEVHSSYKHPIYLDEIEDLKSKFNPVDVIENLCVFPRYEIMEDPNGNGEYDLHIAPLNEKNLFAGRLYAKEKEVVISVSETNFNLNRNYYKSLIGTKCGEYTIVGIIQAPHDTSVNLYLDYYASKADFEAYLSSNPNQENIIFDFIIYENQQSILFSILSKEDFLNCVIDNSLPDDTIASSKVEVETQYVVRFDENFQTYEEVFDCIPSEHLLVMNENTFKKFTDENAKKCTKFYFNTFKECEEFIAYLNSEGISYSMRYNKYNTQVKTLCIIVAFILIVGFYFVIGMMNRKVNRNRDLFYNKCGYDKKKLWFAKILSSTIIVFISALIYAIVYAGLSQVKYTSDNAYFALRWMTLQNGVILGGLAILIHISVEMIIGFIPRKKLR